MCAPGKRRFAGERKPSSETASLGNEVSSPWSSQSGRRELLSLSQLLAIPSPERATGRDSVRSLHYALTPRPRTCRAGKRHTASQGQGSTAQVPALTLSLASSPQQSFEKQGFHTGTPAASFNLPSALGSGGPINPATAAAYPPTPFMHILTPHQQPHSQILHHHLQQDGQVSNPPGPPGPCWGIS